VIVALAGVREARRLAWPGGDDRGTLPARGPRRGGFAVDGGAWCSWATTPRPSPASGVEVASTVALVDLDPDGGAPRPRGSSPSTTGTRGCPRTGPARPAPSRARTVVRWRWSATGSTSACSPSRRWGRVVCAPTRTSGARSTSRGRRTGGRCSREDRTARRRSSTRRRARRSSSRAATRRPWARSRSRPTAAGSDGGVRSHVRVFDARTGTPQSHRTEAGADRGPSASLPEGDGLRLDAAGGFEVWARRRSRRRGPPRPPRAPRATRCPTCTTWPGARRPAPRLGRLGPHRAGVGRDDRRPAGDPRRVGTGLERGLVPRRRRIALATRHGDVALFDAATGARIARHDAVRTGEMVGRCRFLPSGDSSCRAAPRRPPPRRARPDRPRPSRRRAAW
jgi:hypothetical protein